MEMYTDYQAVGVRVCVPMSVIVPLYWKFNLKKIQLGLIDKRDFVNCKIMAKHSW